MRATAKIACDPEKVGRPFTSPGAHDHWNNATGKKSTRHPGPGAGIELARLLPAP